MVNYFVGGSSGFCFFLFWGGSGCLVIESCGLFVDFVVVGDCCGVYF